MSLAETPAWDPAAKARRVESVARPACRGALLGVLIGVLCGAFPGGYGEARAQSRADWVAMQIAAHNQHLSASLRADKFAAMAESELHFFRATSYLYWADWGRAPQLQSFGGPRTRIWLQGDAHAENIGALANNRGTVVYDLNDFDESIIGDYQLDLWRLATSLLVIGHDQGGFSPQMEGQIVTALSRSYLRTLQRFRDNNDELTYTITAANAPPVLADFLLDLERKGTRRRMLGKSTTTDRGVRRFDTSNPDYAPVSPDVLAAIERAMPAYIASLAGRARYADSYYRIKDVAQRSRGGMGSLGVTRYLVLIEGPSSSQDDDRILDVKAQDVPAGWRYTDEGTRDSLFRAMRSNHALRVISARRAMGYRADEHLGVMAINGEDFAVCERLPVHASFSVGALTPNRALLMAEVWGAVLATAHARSDRDASSLIPYDFEREVLSAVEGREEAFHARVRQVAIVYAGKVRDDFLTFLDRIPHEPSPAGYEPNMPLLPRRGAVSRTTRSSELLVARSDPQGSLLP